MAQRVLQPGMDEGQAQSDRVGWQTTTDMVLGKGVNKDFQDGAGYEVGNQYDCDPMGEEYEAVTYATSEPDAKSVRGPDGPAPQSYTVGNKGGN